MDINPQLNLILRLFCTNPYLSINKLLNCDYLHIKSVDNINSNNIILFIYYYY